VGSRASVISGPTLWLGGRLAHLRAGDMTATWWRVCSSSRAPVR